MSKWIESGGGPLLLVARSLAPRWLGTHGSENSSGQTDYQRACAVVEEMEAIPFGSAQAVVFGDEPDRTCILEGSSDLLILRWRWAESEDSLFGALRQNLNVLPFVATGAFTTVVGEHLLFDSACAGAEVIESLSVRLNASEFLLETALFNPTKDIFAVIHRLRPTPK